MRIANLSPNTRFVIWFVGFSVLYLCPGYKILPSYIVYGMCWLFVLCMGPVIGKAFQSVYRSRQKRSAWHSVSMFFFMFILTCTLLFCAVDAPFYILLCLFRVRITGADETNYLLSLFFSAAGQ
jgi:hypothetical protein